MNSLSDPFGGQLARNPLTLPARPVRSLTVPLLPTGSLPVHRAGHLGALLNRRLFTSTVVGVPADRIGSDYPYRMRSHPRMRMPLSAQEYPRMDHPADPRLDSDGFGSDFRIHGLNGTLY